MCCEELLQEDVCHDSVTHRGLKSSSLTLIYQRTTSSSDTNALQPSIARLLPDSGGPLHTAEAALKPTSTLEATTDKHTHTHQLPPFLNRGRLDRIVPALTRISIFHLCSDTPSLLWDSVQPPAGTYCTGCGRVARGWRSFWCFSFFSFYFRVFEKKGVFEAECYRGGCFYFVFVCFFLSNVPLFVLSIRTRIFLGFFFSSIRSFESHQRRTMKLWINAPVLSFNARDVETQAVFHIFVCTWNNNGINADRERERESTAARWEREAFA